MNTDLTQFPRSTLPSYLPSPKLDTVTITDLYTLCDVENVESGLFLHSTFSWIDSDDYVYFGTASQRRTNLMPEDLRSHLKPVEDAKVYPRETCRLSTVSMPIAGDVFIKRPKLTCFGDPECATMVPRMVLEEAEILQKLMETSHPNLARYHGCTSRRGYITGIVLDLYPMTLELRLQKGAEDFDTKKCMSDVEAGIAHLHCLGLAHNDLNPENIVVDKDDNAIIIDFGSCRPFGQLLMTAGTLGWVDDDDEDFYKSEQKHDEFALNKLRMWLGGRRVTTFATFED